MKVAVSGAMGRLGSVVAKGVANAEDMQLSGVYAPGHPGQVVAGMEIETSMENIDADIVVECTHPNVVMENLRVARQRHERCCRNVRFFRRKHRRSQIFLDERGYQLSDCP